MGDLDLRLVSLHGSTDPPESVLNSNGISIASAVFARLTNVADRPTDRPTDHATRSVTIDRIYVRSAGERKIGLRTITPFKVIQGRRFWYKNRLPISD